jgi:hypothetical protein
MAFFFTFIGDGNSNTINGFPSNDSLAGKRRRRPGGGQRRRRPRRRQRRHGLVAAQVSNFAR